MTEMLRSLQVSQQAKIIERLKAALDTKSVLLAEAVKVMEPFAAFAESIAAHHPGWDHDGFMLELGDKVFPLGPFRRARAILAKIKAANAKPAPQPEGPTCAPT